MEWGEGGGVQKSFLYFRKETTTMGQLIILFVGLSFDQLNFGSYCNFKGTSFKLLNVIYILLRKKWRGHDFPWSKHGFWSLVRSMIMMLYRV